MNFSSIFREPLVHFLLAGAALFIVTAVLKNEGQTGQKIEIEREDLLVFMQSRAQVFDEKAFDAILDKMSDEERAQLVRDTALQEVLYREGQSLNLAAADPLIRQRIIQQTRLLLMEEAAADIQISDDQLSAFYQSNKAQYSLAPEITFTHVFFAGENSRDEARAMVETLRANNVRADQAGQYGERFLYQINYSKASQQALSSQFGDSFSKAIFQLETGTWQGPVQSDHGWHILLPRSLGNAREPAFSDIAGRVREDALAEMRQQVADRALDKLMANYEIDAPW